MSDTDLAAAAGEAVAESARWLRADASSILLVQRGDDDLWESVTAALDRQGAEVHRLRLPAGQRAWSLPRPDTAGRFDTGEALVAADIVVHHDPLGPVPRGPGGGGETLEGLRVLTARGIGVVFVDYPHGLRPGTPAGRLRRHYLRALSHPVESLQGDADRLAQSLAGHDHLTVFSGPRGQCRLDVDGPFEVRTDWTSARRDAPVLQMPFAEVWVACDPRRVQGRLAMAGSEGSTPFATVENGNLRWDAGGELSDPLVEIGIGINPDVRPVGRTSLFEKAHGFLHAGFGDSSLIGGRQVAPNHYDLPLAPGSVLRTEPAVEEVE